MPTITIKPTAAAKPSTVRVPDFGAANSTPFGLAAPEHVTPTREIRSDAWNLVVVSSDYHARMTALLEESQRALDAVNFRFSYASVAVEAAARIKTFGLHAVDESDDDDIVGELIVLPTKIVPESDDI